MLAPSEDREGINVGVVLVNVGQSVVRGVFVGPPSDGKALIHVANKVANRTVQAAVVKDLVVEDIVGEPAWSP